MTTNSKEYMREYQRQKRAGIEKPIVKIKKKEIVKNHKKETVKDHRNKTETSIKTTQIITQKEIDTFWDIHTYICARRMKKEITDTLQNFLRRMEKNNKKKGG